MSRPPPAAAAPLLPREAFTAARRIRRRVGRSSPAWGAALCTTALLTLSTAVRADALDTLRAFVRDVKSGRAAFTQTVTSADGAKQ